MKPKIQQHFVIGPNSPIGVDWLEFIGATEERRVNREDCSQCMEWLIGKSSTYLAFEVCIGGRAEGIHVIACEGRSPLAEDRQKSILVATDPTEEQMNHLCMAMGIF